MLGKGTQIKNRYDGLELPPKVRAGGTANLGGGNDHLQWTASKARGALGTRAHHCRSSSVMGVLHSARAITTTGYPRYALRCGGQPRHTSAWGGSPPQSCAAGVCSADGRFLERLVEFMLIW